MAASPCIQCRVDPQLKLRLRAIAAQQGLTESGLLKRLTVAAIYMAPRNETPIAPVEKISSRARVYVRLRPGDHALLRERAATRGLACATYVSMLVRAHLHAVVPLPDRELTELKRSVAALGAVGRNLNQIARVAHRSGFIEGLSTEDLQILQVTIEELRHLFKTVIEANISSWETGYAKTACGSANTTSLARYRKLRPARSSGETDTG